jgi:hypothetical protein
MVTLPGGDRDSILLRTDFRDDDAWRAAVARPTAPQLQASGDVFQAQLEAFEDPALDGLVPADLAALPSAGFLSYAFVADARTMEDHTFVVLDLHEERGRTFRCTAGAVQAVENNLSLANMDFFEFADACDDDGVFRDFR